MSLYKAYSANSFRLHSSIRLRYSMALHNLDRIVIFGQFLSDPRIERAAKKFEQLVRARGYLIIDHRLDSRSSKNFDNLVAFNFFVLNTPQLSVQVA